ncbi:MAG TPA: trypsin-like peptidase domain-containing protein [Blastocatellia bacterium]|jgi:S1-C subfamily serine protease|nr:trypsin-like peptidase domain-containing protein [Blastocatellia bacterium]
MKEGFLRVAVWLSLSLLMALSLASEATAADGECDKSAATIYQTASPAVVYISATTINPYRLADRVEHIVGSGFIIDGEGLALTNSHVVFGRQSLTVRLSDGTTLPARLLGADPLFDIAVLQIPKPEDSKLPVLALGDSNSVRVGEDVLALGNPLGLDQSLTRGIVSAVNRILPPTFFSLQEPFIQVDTPINHGNSGGPLLNRCGEVIGITTAIISDAQNIGLVIPINLAKEALPELLKNGHLSRPWLGFHGQFIDNNLKRLLRLPLRTGFLIEAIEPGSPAELAQLRGGDLELTIAGDDFLLGGDIITMMNGKRLDSPESVVNALQELKVGGDISLTIFRDGKTQEVTYKLSERPLLPGDIADQAVATPVSGRQIGKSARLKF